jgi:putative transposase
MSSYRFKSKAKDQGALTRRLAELARTRVRYGYRRLHVLLRREGWKVNYKRVYRLYKLEGLSLRLKVRKKRISAARGTGPVPTAPNECWSMDFVSDRLTSGRRYRALTIVDNFTRESPPIEADVSLTGAREARVHDRASLPSGPPKRIKVDNGPEFISRALDLWAHERGVELEFSRPGTPTDNPFIESFNGRLRRECLDQHWFESLEEARRTLELWREDYNQQRPHSSLGMLTPAEFKQTWLRPGSG